MSTTRKAPAKGSHGRKEPLVLRPATADADCIRVRLNHRTVVLLKSMKSFESWKTRYPEAQVIEVVPGPKDRKGK